MSNRRNDLPLGEVTNQLLRTLQLRRDGDEAQGRPVFRPVLERAQQFGARDEHHRIVRPLARMADRRTLGVRAEDDRLVSCTAALQLGALFGASHAHRTRPEPQAVDREAHRRRHDRRISVLRRLGGEGTERCDDVALRALQAARGHQQRMRTARTEDVVSSCAVQMDVDVARDDQPVHATSARGECRAVARARNGDDLAHPGRIDPDDRVVDDLPVDQRCAANASRRGRCARHVRPPRRPAMRSAYRAT